MTRNLIVAAGKSLAVILLATTLAACPMDRPSSPGSGVIYRAVGQEPGWSLTMDRWSINFARMGGMQIREPRPEPILTDVGRIYSTRRIRLTIRQVGCTDTMSGQQFADRVEVVVDGRRFNGCGGGAVRPSSLSGTDWRVISVNGRAVPRNGDYHVRFDNASRISAKFGCNSINGSVRQVGNSLNPGPLATTRMACQEPAMSFETQGEAILARPMTMSWSGGDRLTLSNGSGRIELRRTF
jgi:heat shock protein HslJ